MSLSALLQATRNTLREELTNFYGTNVAKKNASCRIMPSDLPAPNCGEEFIAIYGGTHRPRQIWPIVAIEEQFGIVIAVTRRASFTPRDHRGENLYILSDEYSSDMMSLEARCREIVGLIDKNYQLLRDADALFDNAAGFSEPLVWVGTDPNPTEVGAEHFCAYHSAISESGMNEPIPLPGIPHAEDIYGLLMHIRFDEAVRLQHSNLYDQPAPA